MVGIISDWILFRFFILHIGKSIMFLLGEMIPKLKGRQVKGAAAAEPGSQAQSSNKKNKKRR